MPFREDTPDIALIHQAVEHHAAARPDQVAVDDGSRTLTYVELNLQAGRLASVLRAGGAGRNDRVGVLLGNGLEACVAVTGALKADCCYVPLHPGFPPARIAAIIEDARLQAVVTEGAHLERLGASLELVGEDARPAHLVVLGPAPGGGAPPAGVTRVSGADTLAAAPDRPPPARNVEEDLAYIMYTSGTTGRPKGVMVTHAAVTSFLRWAVGYFGLGPRDRMSNHSHLSFDLSVFDVLGGFLAGATICPLVSPGDLMAPGRFIRERRITVWFSVPSVIGMLRRSRQLTPGVFSGSLRAAIFCGEALAPDLAEAWIQTHPDVPIYNLYGPTEATVACTCHHVNADAPFRPEALVPIGRPCRDVEILILDRDSDVPAEPGTVGRIMICGTQLAAGYWRRPELTQRAFRVNPMKREIGARMYESGDLGYVGADGLLYCVGREDTQVKIMGYRIELSEIEVVFSRHPSVHEVAVVCIEPKNPRLVAAVATGPDAPADREAAEEALLDHGERFLPAYMVPKQVEFFDRLPRNANGKIDRAAIAAQVTGKPA